MYIIIILLVFIILYLFERYEKFSLNNLLDNIIQAIPIFGFDETKESIKKTVEDDLKQTVRQLEGLNILNDKIINNSIGVYPNIDTGITKDTENKYCQTKYFNVFSVKENSNNFYIPKGKYVLF
jgi:hypothetical protein